MPKLDSELPKASGSQLMPCLSLKVCSKCKKEKTVDCFNTDINRKDNLTIYCKDCLKISGKVYREKNKDKLVKARKEYKYKNKKTIAAKDAIYFQENKERIRARNTDYREANKEAVFKQRKKSRDKCKARRSKYYANHYLEIVKPRRQADNGEYNKTQREYRQKRCELDIEFKLRILCRRRFSDALKAKTAPGRKRIEDITGCSMSDLKKYLETLFKTGMTWGNHGLHGWHIDHIKPCAAFDLTDKRQQRECFHFTNLQPLWAEENWAKGSKHMEASDARI